MNPWVAFALGWAAGWATFITWLSWDAITETLRRKGLTVAELRKPIAWDGPWTDGQHFWDHGNGWREPKCKMKWRSPTGRNLISYGNKLDAFETAPSGSCVYS